MSIVAFICTAIAFYLLGAGSVLLLAARLGKSEQSTPVRHVAAIGAGPVVNTSDFGKPSHDWDGGIWNPTPRGLA
jgi:hypothetical protein